MRTRWPKKEDTKINRFEKIGGSLRASAYQINSLCLKAVCFSTDCFRGGRLSSVGFFLLVLISAAPVQADTTLTTLRPTSGVIKPENIDKSALRFQQTHYEYHRLQQAAQEADERVSVRESTNFDQLRARLLSPQLSISSNAAEVASTPASGTYLYGEQPIANQPNTTYFVFESRGVELTGALYMPSSSFDCVRGQIRQEQITLEVTDSYSQERFSHALLLASPSVQVANQTRTITIPPVIEGFYSLPVQESDRTLLTTCQTI